MCAAEPHGRGADRALCLPGLLLEVVADQLLNQFGGRAACLPCDAPQALQQLLRQLQLEPLRQGSWIQPKVSIGLTWGFVVCVGGDRRHSLVPVRQLVLLVVELRSVSSPARNVQSIQRVRWPAVLRGGP